MKTFNTFGAAFIVLLAYAFYLGYTQDNVHPIVATIWVVEQNIAVATVVVTLTLTAAFIACHFSSTGELVLRTIVGQKTIVHEGIEHFTLAKLWPFRKYQLVGEVDRKIMGYVVIHLRVNGKVERFLIEERMTFGLEPYSLAKERATATALSSKTLNGAWFIIALSTRTENRNGLILVPAETKKKTAIPKAPSWNEFAAENFEAILARERANQTAAQEAAARRKQQPATA